MSGSLDRPEIEWTADRIARLWDYYGAREAHRDAFFSRRYQRHIYKLIRQRIPLRGAHILDYGCGPGFILEELARHNVTCSGLEFSTKTAEEATRRLGGLGSFRGVVVADSLPSRFEAGSFDAVLCIEVIEHLTDDRLDPTLQELHRLLRPGGTVYLSTPNQENLDTEKVACPNCGSIFHRWQHVRSWSLATLQAAMEAQGFTTRSLWEMLFVQNPRSLLGLAQGIYSMVSGYRPHLVYVGVK